LFSSREKINVRDFSKFGVIWMLSDKKRCHVIHFIYTREKLVHALSPPTSLPKKVKKRTPKKFHTRATLFPQLPGQPRVRLVKNFTPRTGVIKRVRMFFFSFFENVWKNLSPLFFPLRCPPSPPCIVAPCYSRSTLLPPPSSLLLPGSFLPPPSSTTSVIHTCTKKHDALQIIGIPHTVLNVWHLSRE
jgi:hypothetical protein